MDTQNRTSRSEGLDNIVESMYTSVTEGETDMRNRGFDHERIARKSAQDAAAAQSTPKEPITISPGKGEEYLSAQKAIGDHEARMTDLGWNRCSHGCVPSVEGNRKSLDYGQVKYTHADGAPCRVCKGSGFLDAEGSPPSGQRRVIGDPEPDRRDDWVNASTEIKVEADYVPPHDEGKLKRAKKRGYNDDNDDSDIDHHNKYMMDQDLLQPIHQAASIATDGEAKNFNEWLILQIKDQGDNWIDWFIETVIVEERFKD